MQRCPDQDCGHQNRPSARFCERCGKPLRARRWSALRSGHLMRGGAYRIIEPLGKGGMGALYLAADTGAFDRQCVVKELLDYYDPSDPDEAQQAQSRFETEARLLAELSHPGIPRIYSYFSEAGRHYIVMEYIEGETLELAVTHVNPVGREIPPRRLSAEEVIRHAIRICRVLEYLADRPTPVIHHDIKPANLIVDRTSREARLVDFGTAQTRVYRAAHAQPGDGSSAVFGTQGYAAPEQYQGRSEPRSDVYALAATVYHLLADDDPGDHPFQFPQMAALPTSLADALTRALRKEVQRRSSALELRHALEAWLIPEKSAHPFVFRSGAVAHTTEELVALSDQHWSEARQHLAEGDFDRWFRTRNRHDLVAKARSAKLENNANAALEAFLRRLNPRLPPPKLTIEPLLLDFGRVTLGGAVARRLKVRNEGRGYGQVSLSASVPWLQFRPAQVGCLPGAEAFSEVQIDTAALPLQRDHQAVVTCTPARGPRVSIPMVAHLDLMREGIRRVFLALRSLARLAAQGAQNGLGLWKRAFHSLIRSRYGRWVLLGEALLLFVVLAVLGWSWFGPADSPEDLAKIALVSAFVALLAVCLLPVLVFVGGGIVLEGARALLDRVRPSRGGR